MNLLFTKVFGYVYIMYRDMYRISIALCSDTYRIELCGYI